MCYSERNISIVVGLLLSILLLSACTSRQLRSDYDTRADFSQYRTYNFYEQAGPRDTEYRSFFSEYMMVAISKEMEARGYEKSDDPDLLVNFNGMLQEKARVTTSTVPSMTGAGWGWDSYYDYRSGFYDPWMDYGYTTETRISEYTEGTFNIDLIDARKNKLVWEVVGVSDISQKELEELEETVNKGVPAYFAEYPFRAGSGRPISN